MDLKSLIETLRHKILAPQDLHTRRGSLRSLILSSARVRKLVEVVLLIAEVFHVVDGVPGHLLAPHDVLGLSAGVNALGHFFGLPLSCSCSACMSFGEAYFWKSVQRLMRHQVLLILRRFHRERKMNDDPLESGSISLMISHVSFLPRSRLRPHLLASHRLCVHVLRKAQGLRHRNRCLRLRNWHFHHGSRHQRVGVRIFKLSWINPDNVH